VVSALLDTSILVDVLRKHPPALAWLSVQSDLGTTPVVWLELIEGARDSRSQRQALRLLQDFERIDVLPADFDRTIYRLPRLHLSHNVGMNDCLIAAVSERLNLALYTTNLRHFTPLIDSLAQQPY
jgi:predicted nucleic acid-binding protein